VTAAPQPHGSPHTHPHPAEDENPFAGQGAVMLDIGDDVGALVVQMPARMLGVEIEIRPAGTTSAPGHHPHVAVVERPTPSGMQPSLVYADLREGSYELCPKGGGPALASASVVGGEVTHLGWPAPPSLGGAQPA
jgi:hypothetical protein